MACTFISLCLLLREFHLRFLGISILFLLFQIQFLEKPVSKLTGENAGTYKANRKKVFRKKMKGRIIAIPSSHLFRVDLDRFSTKPAYQMNAT